jgi:hypothetical protein
MLLCLKPSCLHHRFGWLLLMFLIPRCHLLTNGSQNSFDTAARWHTWGELPNSCRVWATLSAAATLKRFPRLGVRWSMLHLKCLAGLWARRQTSTPWVSAALKVTFLWHQCILEWAARSQQPWNCHELAEQDWLGLLAVAGYCCLVHLSFDSSSFTLVRDEWYSLPYSAGIILWEMATGAQPYKDLVEGACPLNDTPPFLLPFMLPRNSAWVPPAL